ncbi:MAG: VTT domain-containing protein [bacterium]
MTDRDDPRPPPPAAAATPAGERGGEAEGPPSAAAATPAGERGGEAAGPPPRKPWIRVALLVALVAALYLAAHLTGAAESFTVAGLRARVHAAGPIGGAVFVLCFIVGNLIHLPGILFVAVALLAWGRIDGTLLALAGGLVAVTTSFVIVRAVGGTPLAAPRHPWARAVLAHLDERPVAVIALLRLAFQFSPPVNYALALSRVRLRDYLVGSTLGLAVFMTGVALLFEEVLRRFG